MTRSFPSPFGRIEELALESRSLVALARALVGDADQAEDLVQDAWLAALRSPPRSSIPLRGWLATTLKRLGSNARRAATRRSDHELRQAPPDEQDSHVDVLERLEMQRLVLEQVQRLREPSRSVVYLRYWEGLETVAIAARLGVPVKTVRSRIARGLAELRQRMDAATPGGRERWLPALAALAARAPSASVLVTPSSALAPGLPVLPVVCGLLAVTLSLLAYRLLRPGEAELGSLGAPATAATAPPHAHPVDSLASGLRHVLAPDAPRAAQEPAAAAAPAEPPASAPEGLLSLSVRVLWREAAPPSGALSVSARDEGGEHAFAAEGERAGDLFRFERLRPGPYWLQLWVTGWRSEPLQVRLRAGEPEPTLTLVAHPIPGVAVRLRTPTGQPWKEALSELGWKEPTWLPVVVSEHEPTGHFLDPAQARAALFRGATEQEASDSDLYGRLELLREPPLWASLLLGQHLLASRPLAPGSTEVVFTLDPERFRSAFARLSVRVADARSGQVLARANVAIATRGVEREVGLSSRDGGTVTFEHVEPGPLQLRVRAPGRAELVRELVVEPGAAIDLGTLAIEPPIVLRGRVRAWPGPSSPRVQAWRGRSQGRILGTPVEVAVAPDGSFELQLGPGEHWIRASCDHEGRPWRSEVRRVDVGGAQPELVLELVPTVDLVVRSGRAADARDVSLADEGCMESGVPSALSSGPVRFRVLPGPHRLLIEEPTGEREELTLAVGPEGAEIPLD